MGRPGRRATGRRAWRQPSLLAWARGPAGPGVHGRRLHHRRAGPDGRGPRRPRPAAARSTYGDVRGTAAGAGGRRRELDRWPNDQARVRGRLAARAAGGFVPQGLVVDGRDGVGQRIRRHRAPVGLAALPPSSRYDVRTGERLDRRRPGGRPGGRARPGRVPARRRAGRRRARAVAGGDRPALAARPRHAGGGAGVGAAAAAARVVRAASTAEGRLGIGRWHPRLRGPGATGSTPTRCWRSPALDLTEDAGRRAHGRRRAATQGAVWAQALGRCARARGSPRPSPAAGSWSARSRRRGVRAGAEGMDLVGSTRLWVVSESGLAALPGAGGARWCRSCSPSTPSGVRRPGRSRSCTAVSVRPRRRNAERPASGAGRAGRRTVAAAGAWRLRSAGLAVQRCACGRAGRTSSSRAGRGRCAGSSW